MPEGPEKGPQAARLVLLGASNLFLGLPHALRHALGRLGGREVSVFAAHGPGRSYGREAGILGVQFTGILRSGILERLERECEARGPAPTSALLTDVGNDVLYRSGVRNILSWVREIAERLLALGARVGITSLPVESIEALPPYLFRLLRPIYFPFRPIAREEVLSQVRSIEDGLNDLGRATGVRVLPTRSAWYGFDHFHLRGPSRSEAFSTWLDGLLCEGGSAADRGRCAARLKASSIRLRFHRPAEYLLLARRLRGRQDGLPIAPGARLHSY